MSYVGIFTALCPLDPPEDANEEGTKAEAGVRILDVDAFEEHMEMDQIGGSQVTGTRTYGDYPPEEYRILYGFDSSSEDISVWGPQTELTIHNFGYKYNGEEGFTPFWERVSEYTDAFEFWHSPKSAAFPDSYQIHVQDHDPHLIHVTAEEGTVEVEEIHICEPGEFEER